MTPLPIEERAVFGVNGTSRSQAHPASSGAVHRIVRNSAGNLTAQGIYAVLHLAAVFVLARYLGKEVFGQYYTFFALIIAVQMVVELGLSTVLTCRIAQSPHSWKEAVADAVGIFTILSLVSGCLFPAAGMGWMGLKGDWGLWWSFVSAGVACAAMQGQRFAAGVLHAFEQFAAENLAKILQGGIFLALILGLVQFSTAARTGEALLGEVLGLLAISHIVATLYLIWQLQRQRQCLAWPKLDRHFWPRIKSWFQAAVPLGMGDAVRGLTWQLDTLLLGLLQPPGIVGIYSVAYRPLGPLNWLPRAVVTASFPSFARMADGQRRDLQYAFATSMRLLWIVALPLAVTLCICAEPAILILAGPEYLEAAAPMRILIWIAALSFVSYHFRFLFTALGRARLFIALVSVVLAIEAVLELALIPYWSYYGACLGSVTGEICFTVAGLWLCRRLGVRAAPWKEMTSATLAAAAMAAILYPLRGLSLPLLFPAIAATTIAYFVLCVAFGALRYAEVQRFIQMATTVTQPSTAPATACEEAAVGDLTVADSQLLRAPGDAVPRQASRGPMDHANVKERYQDQVVVQCYDRKRFYGPIGRTIDALEKRAISKALTVVRNEVRHPESMAVLDVPCGTGRITQMLLDQGMQVVAGDISLPMLEVARGKLARHGDRVTFQRLDLESLELPDNSYDLITCIRLFNHVAAPERARMLRELARVARRFVIANMSFSSLPYRYMPYLKAGLGMPLPKVLPTWPELHQEMAEVGFQIRDYFFELRFLSEVVVVLLEKAPAEVAASEAASMPQPSDKPEPCPTPAPVLEGGSR